MKTYEQRKEYYRSYYQAHKDEYKAYSRKWRQDHPGKTSEYWQNWREKNLEYDLIRSRFYNRINAAVKSGDYITAGRLQQSLKDLQELRKIGTGVPSTKTTIG